MTLSGRLQQLAAGTERHEYQQSGADYGCPIVIKTQNFQWTNQDQCIKNSMHAWHKDAHTKGSHTESVVQLIISPSNRVALDFKDSHAVRADPYKGQHYLHNRCNRLAQPQGQLCRACSNTTSCQKQGTFAKLVVAVIQSMIMSFTMAVRQQFLHCGAALQHFQTITTKCLAGHLACNQTAPQNMYTAASTRGLPVPALPAFQPLPVHHSQHTSPFPLAC